MSKRKHIVKIGDHVMNPTVTRDRCFGIVTHIYENEYCDVAYLDDIKDSPRKTFEVREPFYALVVIPNTRLHSLQHSLGLVFRNGNSS